MCLPMTSMSRVFWLTASLILSNLSQRLFVLKTLNFLTLLKSSKWSLGTCATSSSLRWPSYWIRVPPLTSALVLSVTSMMKSDCSRMHSLKMLKSTMAPRLSMLLRNTYFLP